MMLRCRRSSLYVHMPWCVRKCPYCDFNSHAAPEPIPQRQYIDALLEDLAIDRRRCAGPRARVDLLRRRHAEPVRARMRSAASWSARARWSPSRRTSRSRSKPIPGTIEHGRFAAIATPASIAFRSARRPSTTDTCARSAAFTAAATSRARSTSCAAPGIDNFNLDLMYGLPAQTLRAGARRSRRGACARAGAHFALPADARAGHGLLSSPAAAAGF